MGKKRIFELARELGYTNRDLIDKLQKLGFEVKSHSSSVDDQEVKKALKREEDERRDRTEERRISRGVIRRRPRGGDAKPQVIRRPGAAAQRAAPKAAAEEAPPAVDLAKTAGTAKKVVVSSEEKIKTEPQPTETPPAVVAAKETKAPKKRVARPKAPEEKTPAPEKPEITPPPKAEPKPAKRVARVARPTAKPVELDAKDSEPSNTASASETLSAPGPEADEAASSAESDGEKRERREARPARPDRKRDDVYDEEDEKPEVEDVGISVSDFTQDSAERMEKSSTRVAPPTPSTVAAAKKEEAAQSKIVRTIDPSVLKARLKASKRPEPPKEWGKPMELAASPVTELVVRTDASGKRKELVDVRKEAARGKTRGARRREEMSAKDLLEHRRGQVYYPAVTRKRTRGKKVVKRVEATQPLVKRPIQIGDFITVAELSQQMSRKAAEVIGWLMKNGVMATMNQPIDHDTAGMVCAEFGYETVSTKFKEEAFLTGKALTEAKEAHDESSPLRAPVVTVMGHVDHGKTSLLDKIRSANVADGEAGGITQRIAGYQVHTSKGPITFLDTPGHAAFTAMRARGAHVTDIVVLVVAADDGVMPQTVEAIEHAKAAEVPIIVAINKIDKAEANPDRVLQQLAEHGVLVETYGGDVLNRQVSAKTGDGIDPLLELIALQAEIMELRADPNAPAVGVVVEGHIHKGRGPVATVLVQEGTVRKGEIIVVGERVGKVRAMMTDGGKTVKEAGPSVPVEVLGLDGVPQPGDDLRVATGLDGAKALAAHRVEKRRSTELAGQSTVSLKDLFSRIKTGAQKELKIVIKADVQGSVEALRDALTAQSTPKVKVSVISGGVGAVVESDVEFARASEAIVVGFGVRPDTKALKAARALDVDIRTYNIIYEAVDEVKLAMRGLLSPVSKEKYLGRADVRQTFSVPKVGTVAGCAVVDGVVSRSANIRLLRDSKPIYEGKLSSLKRFKDDVREVKEGLECGMGIEKFNDIKEGDIIEAFEIVLTEAVLDEPTGAGGAPEAHA